MTVIASFDPKHVRVFSVSTALRTDHSGQPMVVPAIMRKLAGVVWEMHAWQ